MNEAVEWLEKLIPNNQKEYNREINYATHTIRPMIELISDDDLHCELANSQNYDLENHDTLL